MGFKVISPKEVTDDEPNNQPECYSGVSRQLSQIGKILRTDLQRNEHYS
jgi:hypothetical protein